MVDIQEILKSRIIKGEYAIGEKLKEVSIADELGVSRTPVRDAFKALCEEGLVECVPNKGCFARGFTKRDIDDIYEVRKALEIMAVKWSVCRITAEEINELHEQCDLMEFYAERNNVKKVLELNKDFHEIIYNSTGSRFMSQVLRSYKAYIEQTKKTLYYDAECLQKILSEHRCILEKIEEKDEAGACEAIAAHLDNSKKRAEMVWKV